MDILIDFDGTVVTHVWPEIGEDIGAVPVLKELVAKGHNLILFTMRSGESLKEAVKWFKLQDIPLYGVQSNPTQHTWTSSPKAYGQLIIDDICLGIPLIHNAVAYWDKEDYQEIKLPYSERPYVDWVKVRQMLIQKRIL